MCDHNAAINVATPPNYQVMSLGLQAICAAPWAMANKSTTAKVSRQNGDLTVQQHETDSPILPVPQLEQLQRFKPEAVEWVLRQTQIEAETRRQETHRINTLVFIERLLGQISHS